MLILQNRWVKLVERRLFINLGFHELKMARRCYFLPPRTLSLKERRHFEGERRVSNVFLKELAKS